ncbi:MULTISPECIES: DUF6126 family protein [Streptomyces]|uniref:DUF6126 family protein n=1 Tax=Streptomyces TaxID=1883 RepID=UPI0029315E77|nr:DUF6126 family protein [Streptomyces sasae]
MTEQVSDGSAGEQRKRKAKKKDREWQIERGVAIRAGFYIFGTHIVAGWVILLFYLGRHAH